jgi:hypothetical protein
VTPFWLLIGSITILQVVNTINYNTATHLQSLHANLFTLYAYSVSLNHTLQIKPSIYTLHLHRQISRILLVYEWLGCRYIPFETASKNCLGRLRCLQDNPSAWTIQKSKPLYYCGRVFIATLHSSGHGAARIENAVLLLLPLLCRELF